MCLIYKYHVQFTQWIQVSVYWLRLRLHLQIKYMVIWAANFYYDLKSDFLLMTKVLVFNFLKELIKWFFLQYIIQCEQNEKEVEQKPVHHLINCGIDSNICRKINDYNNTIEADTTIHNRNRKTTRFQRRL